jgi:hypothetical protein
MESQSLNETTKQFSTLTEEEKKNLRKQRFNALQENVNTIDSIEVIKV